MSNRPMPSEGAILQFAKQIEPLYRMFGWHWWNGSENNCCGIPSIEKIADGIREQCSQVAKDDHAMRSTSGGLWAEWDGELGRIDFGFHIEMEADQEAR